MAKKTQEDNSIQLQSVAAERAENCFDDFKGPLTPAQALAEANRCLYCYDAPCTKACPTKIDVPEFIRKIATGNLVGSAVTAEDGRYAMAASRVDHQLRFVRESFVLQLTTVGAFRHHDSAAPN